MASNLVKALIRSQILPSSRRNFSVAAAATTHIGIPTDDLVGNHTAKWMQDRSKKSPMELINEVPPIKVVGRTAACEGDTNPALGHPIEFICLDLHEPAICKYCGLRYVQDHHH
ncbi:NADH dehydrogenase [ubiquinone] iron-sulfur protein 6 [Raphanus sativus]|uniref:NADH dehydrogenase [ubiquinone] iron-sulfur protein 6, mitochondrial-like n=1 Tax=Raphanus sativus TaxID=3726 RepID=A0A6J0P1X1_RAPSA|nr:NADH dehydrogenase [ubiquinone] iron-sulfur protein 6, mitochondrial-like [Raphanus sativus]XP_018490660.1 NADH dehydrogenase [ubiquinone] iron-sulfur protein 6, mitochondrial-like [Raphanus sativus]KAJ4892773.1 NADH dehydrogenase [ubiquinone] iron-sulfur protein 6 [Raphanus sativus]